MTKIVKKTDNQVSIQTDKKGKKFVHVWADASGNIIVETERKRKDRTPKLETHKVFVMQVSKIGVFDEEE